MDEIKSNFIYPETNLEPFQKYLATNLISQGLQVMSGGYRGQCSERLPSARQSVDQLAPSPVSH
jgi:hypothetical protein